MNQKDQEYLISEKRKNKPKIFFPIVNTIFGIGFYIFLIVLTIQNEFKISALILVGFLVVLFIFSSWYNSYFSKKKNQKRIYNFQEEADLMFEYGKALRQKTSYKLTSNNRLDFYYTLQDEIICDTFTFDIKSRTFGPLTLNDKNQVIFTLGLSFAGLVIDTENNTVKGIAGMAPCSIWVKKKLKVPLSKKGQVSVDFKNFPSNQTVFQYLDQEDIYYDNKTGWLCFGSFKTTTLDECIEIAKDIYIVMRDNDLVSLWVKIEPNLSIY